LAQVIYRLLKRRDLAEVFVHRYRPEHALVRFELALDTTRRG
jgi:hypothetical protein